MRFTVLQLLFIKGLVQKSLTSRLDNIKGVGPVRKQRLFAYFKTITNMKTGTVKEYQQLGINEKLRMEIIKGLENYEKKNPSSK